jgi:hypothetical protein
VQGSDYAHYGLGLKYIFLLSTVLNSIPVQHYSVHLCNRRDLNRICKCFFRRISCFEGLRTWATFGDGPPIPREGSTVQYSFCSGCQMVFKCFSVRLSDASHNSITRSWKEGWVFTIAASPLESPAANSHVTIVSVGHSTAERVSTSFHRSASNSVLCVIMFVLLGQMKLRVVEDVKQLLFTRLGI